MNGVEGFIIPGLINGRLTDILFADDTVIFVETIEKLARENVIMSQKIEMEIVDKCSVLVFKYEKKDIASDDKTVELILIGKKIYTRNHYVYLSPSSDGC